MSKTKSPPLIQNRHVKELLSIMEANNLPTAKDLRDILDQVAAMERQLDKAVGELSAMREQFADMKQGPMKKTMQKSVIIAQDQMLTLRDRLAELKDKIIEGCRNALAAFKEKGLSALRSITDFLKIRPILEAIRDDLDHGIKQNTAAIEKIQTMSAEYHKAGLHVQNMGRALIGKEASSEAKSSGKLAAAIATPFRNEQRRQLRARQHVTSAIGAVERLQNREHKPPIMETVEKLNRQIEEAKKTAPVMVRPRPVTHDGR